MNWSTALLLVCIVCITVQETIITGDAIWVIPRYETPAIEMAIRDVANDWYKVLGMPPRILYEPPTRDQWNKKENPVIFLGMNATWIKELNMTIPDGKETFSVASVSYHNGKAIVATGTDLRGTIFAIYTFSEKVLGVDPQWYWIDKEPKYVGQVVLQEPFIISEGPPTWEYRGWFFNDEDLLGGFSKDPLGKQVFHSQMWDMLYQTVLRMKCNLVLVGTDPYPDEKSIALAAKRGLVVSNHHFNLLGMNIWRWPDGIPFSFHTNPQVVLLAWEHSVRAQLARGGETVWSVGYRGKNDYPFWDDDSDVNTDQKRADVISNAIHAQVDLVTRLSKEHGKEEPKFITYLWSEAASFYYKGLLVIPEHVSIIFTDDGTGIVIDSDKVAPGAGLYYHIAMLDGHANQLTEMIPPRRIYQQLGHFVKRNATKYCIINVSDVQPYPLTARAISQFMWNSKDLINHTPEDAQSIFLTEWIKHAYDINDPKNIDLVHVHINFFDVPYMASDKLHVERESDNYITIKLDNLNGDLQQSFRDPNHIKDALKNCEDVEKHLMLPRSLPYLTHLQRQANTAIRMIPQERQVFYTGHLLAQIGFHLQGVSAINQTITAIRLLASNNTKEAISSVEQGVINMNLLNGHMRDAEYGRWRGLYMYDHLSNYAGARVSLLQSIAVLEKHHAIPPKTSSPLGYDMYDYQLGREKQFPLFYDGDSTMTKLVRIVCHNIGCSNNAVGGSFQRKAVLTMSTLSKGVIRFTTDGSDVSTSSRIYQEPVIIHNKHNVTIVKAALFDGKTRVAPQSISKWRTN
jgi:hypothetical protein